MKIIFAHNVYNRHQQMIKTINNNRQFIDDDKTVVVSNGNYFSFINYLPLILAMIICGIIGTWVGKKILVSMPENLFGNIFNLILTILAVRLLFEGLKQFI